MLGYKIIDNIKCGFPDNALDKVIVKLENTNISYKVIDETGLILKNKNFKLNKYNKVFDKAKKNVEIITRINLFLKKLEKLEINDIENLLDRLDKCLE